ncbi:MAG TPA: tRNA (adenosine(37)-N6)-threonylcarbamoyltransferase complex ATPase subunit type 1 TsaE [Polyangiaceae bacterium]|nr:tRNA (adenosine(37)-N6)-threonylcarbamoyltransferase complex ATPase subunit type 1 TsaE [Polyangiaceae bacterium]
MKLEVPLPTRRRTIRLGRALASCLSAGDLVILDGPLGSGKTFLVRATCRALGLPASERVTSPTFTLVHEIPVHPPIAHADLYRLTAPEEVAQLGLDALRAEGHALLVEWGAPYQNLLGGDALLISLSITPERSAQIAASGRRSGQALEELRESLRRGS